LLAICSRSGGDKFLKHLKAPLKRWLSQSPAIIERPLGQEAKQAYAEAIANDTEASTAEELSVPGDEQEGGPVAFAPFAEWAG
jgi:hypothetical protein